MPPADIRTSVWKSLIPPAAPIATDVDFNTLGRKFELFPGSIQAAISHAAAEAASRPAASQKIGFKDLLSAGEYEIAKVRICFQIDITTLSSLAFVCFMYSPKVVIMT